MYFEILGRIIEEIIVGLFWDVEMSGVIIVMILVDYLIIIRPLFNQDDIFSNTASFQYGPA